MENHENCCGKIVITENFQIVKADDIFVNYFGLQENESILLSIHPHDIIKLEKAFVDIITDENLFVSARVVIQNGRYRWMLLEMQDDVTDSNERIIKINFYNIESFMETQSESYREVSYLEYFSLLEHLMFSYDSAGSRLKIFMIKTDHQVNIFNGELENWKSMKLSDNAVDKKDIPAFLSLCDDISTGKESFERKLKMVIDGSGRGKEWCVIKGKTIAGDNGNFHVIATMSTVNPVGNNRLDMKDLFDIIDVGTDILNKRAITEYVRNLIASKPDNTVTIAIIDIDNFKIVNDSYGHLVGDTVIHDVAKVISSAVEGIGYAGRIGGDEMMIVVEGLVTNEEIRNVLRYIRSNVGFLYDNNDDMPKVTCSIGSATYPADATVYDDLFNVADKMLYLAKEKGKDRYIIYCDDLHHDYIMGENKMPADSNVILRYKKIPVVNEFINSVILNITDNIEASKEKILAAFDIDSVFIYKNGTDNGWEREVFMGENDYTDDGLYLNDKLYMADFSESNVGVIENINFLERKHPCVYETLKNQNISQSVQIIYPLEDGKIIVSFNRCKQKSKWSQSDINYFAVIANVIGIGYRKC